LTSLSNPDQIVLDTKHGEVVFDNRPLQTITYTPVVGCFPKQKILQIDWKCDYTHWLFYSNDTREKFGTDRLNRDFPLWKCAKWAMFQQHDQYGTCLVFWDFVRQEMVQHPVLQHPYTSDIAMNMHTVGEWEEVFSSNCKPLLMMEHRLKEFVLAREDEELDRERFANLLSWETQSASAPPAPDVSETEPGEREGEVEERDMPRVVRIHMHK